MPLETPTLSIVDNEDGTGAVATVASGNAGATNTLYYHAPRTTLWSTGNDRTGNGTISVPVATGYWFAHVKSVLAGEQTVSNIVYFAATDDDQSVHYRCCLAVQASIQAMITAGRLPEINANCVYFKWQPTDREQTPTPGIFVCPVGRQTNQGGTNIRDDIGYPVFVGLVDAANQDLEANRDVYLQWRQDVSRRFREQDLDVAEIYNVVVEDGDIYDLDEWKSNLWATAFVLRCISREVRGV